MRLSDFFLDKKIMTRSFIIGLSIIFWIYFYVISGVNLFSVIILDLNTIINTFFSLNFLIFLFIFPIPTILMMVFLFKDDISTAIFQCCFGIFIALLVSFFVFGISFLFILFLLFYLLTNIILILITKQKYLVAKKPFEVINYFGSKAVTILSIVLLIIIFIAVAPKQTENAMNMQAGLVNLLVGEDISGWLGASFSLSTACTKQNYSQIITTPQFQDLKSNRDPASISFVQYLESRKEDLDNNRYSRTSDLLPELTSTELKSDVLKTIREIPLMHFVEKYFAIIFSFMVLSVVYVYFVLAFNVLGIGIFYLLLILLYKDIKNNFKKENASSSQNSDNIEKENTSNTSNIEDYKIEDNLSQKNGPKRNF